MAFLSAHYSVWETLPNAMISCCHGDQLSLRETQELIFYIYFRKQQKEPVSIIPIGTILNSGTLRGEKGF